MPAVDQPGGRPARDADADRELVEVLGLMAAGIEKGAAAEARAERRQKEAAEFIPQAVDALLAQRLIEPEEKQAALAHLGDHSRALQTLYNVCVEFGRREAERQKQAGYGLGRPGGVAPAKKARRDDGSRHAEPSEADEMFYRAIMAD